MRFSKGARSVAHQGKQEALEEGGRLVECFLERLVQVYIEFLRFVNILSNSIQYKVCKKVLYDVRF